MVRAWIFKIKTTDDSYISFIHILQASCRRNKTWFLSWVILSNSYHPGSKLTVKKFKLIEKDIFFRIYLFAIFAESSPRLKTILLHVSLDSTYMCWPTKYLRSAMQHSEFLFTCIISTDNRRCRASLIETLNYFVLWYFIEEEYLVLSQSLNHKYSLQSEDHLRLNKLLFLWNHYFKRVNKFLGF